MFENNIFSCLSAKLETTIGFGLKSGVILDFQRLLVGLNMYYLAAMWMYLKNFFKNLGCFIINELTMCIMNLISL